MLALLSMPSFGSPEQTHRSRILHRVTCATMIVVSAFVTLIMLNQPAIVPRGLSIIAYVCALGLVVLHLNRLGHTRPASLLLGGGLICLMSTIAVSAGGVRSPGVMVFCVIVLMVGLLADERAGKITALICGAAGLGLLLAENAGLLPPSVQYSSTTVWLLSCLYMGVVVALLRVPSMLVKAALFQAETELTERRRTEQLLNENRQLLRTMIENTPAAVAMFDTEMRYIAHSKRWLTDYRLGSRDLRGLSHYEVFAEIGEEWKAIHRRCLAGARESREADPFMRADGTKDFIRWVVQPWTKGSGEIGGLTMFTEVITDRIRDEEERKSLREQLLEAQKIEALGTLAGGIAHDFNNILAMIGTNAELGLAEVKEKGAVRTSFQEIFKATDRAKDVVRQILFFSRREKAPLETISLLPVVEDALTFLQASLPASVEIRKNLSPDLPPVRGNASQIYQILLNLGTNARDAMPLGGRLSVSLDQANVTIAEAAASVDLQVGKYVRITIEDSGAGMGHETINRIFEPFFTTKGAQGTGLGLSVVHGIVKSHAGAIRVESREGKGSIFRVYFPAAPVAKAVMAAALAAPVKGQGQHILYIDDEKSVGTATQRLLELMGYRCTYYADPESALKIFRDDPAQFDAVIVDMTMPYLSGLQVAELLAVIRPGIPVAITSGNFNRGSGQDAKGGSIQAWISKPATMADFGAALDKLLHRPS